MAKQSKFIILIHYSFYLLASHEPQPLDDNILRDLNRIVQDAKKVLQKLD